MHDGLVPAASSSLPATWPADRSFVFGQADLVLSTVTLSCKVRPAAKAFLEQAAREVNRVWNFCNATTYKAWHGRYGGTRKWLSAFDLSPLLVGCGDVFDKIGIDVAQNVAAEHATRRSQFKTSKLKWRKSGGTRKSPGWIPFKAANLRFKVNKTTGKTKVCFYGKTIGLFNADYLLDQVRLAKQGVGKIRAGNFAQDALGDWYLNVVVDKVEAPLAPLLGDDSSVGYDPGFKAALTGSDGSILATGFYRELEPKIAQAQSTGHKRQAKRLARQVRRRRLDARNKFCRQVVDTYARIWVGDVSAPQLASSGLKGHGKSVHDAAFGAAYATLEAMGHRAGRVVEKVSEYNSTRRCSSCQALTGPTGLDACVVRQWVCAACGTHHDRDLNSGENIRHTGETGRQACFDYRDHVAAPRYWRPFAGTR